MLAIIVLTLLSFIQAAIIPVNLVLLVLICRSFLAESRVNYWLAFGFGMLLSLLQGYPLGSLSIIYLLAVLGVNLIRKTHFASQWLMVLPLSLIILFLDQFIESKLFSFQLNFWELVPQVLLTIPIYILVRFWDERFIARSDIRLKINK